MCWNSIKRTLCLGKLDIIQTCISHTINTTEIFKHKGQCHFRVVRQHAFTNVRHYTHTHTSAGQQLKCKMINRTVTGKI